MGDCEGRSGGAGERAEGDEGLGRAGVRRVRVAMLGANGLGGVPRRRTRWGYCPGAEPLGAALLCGSQRALAAECRVRRHGGAGFSGVTPWGPGYHGTG